MCRCVNGTQAIVPAPPARLLYSQSLTVETEVAPNEDQIFLSVSPVTAGRSFQVSGGVVWSIDQVGNAIRIEWESDPGGTFGVTGQSFRGTSPMGDFVSTQYQVDSGQPTTSVAVSTRYMSTFVGMWTTELDFSEFRFYMGKNNAAASTLVVYQAWLLLIEV